MCIKTMLTVTVLLVSSLSVSACRGIELENKTVQVEGYTEEQAMILIANEKNRYENAYTEAIWQVTIPETGLRFDKQTVQNVKSFLEQIKLLCMLAEERGITVTSQERDALRQLSEAYMNALSEEDISYIGCSRDDVQKVYTDYFQANKLVRVLTAGVNSEISDSEAKVIEIQQIATSDLKKAKAILKRIKIDGMDFGTMAGRYSELEEVEVKLYRGKNESLYEQTAFSLEEGQVSNILAVDDMYYILKCTNGYDDEETLKRKHILQTAINNQAFQEAYLPYKEEHNIRFAEKFWKDIEITGSDASTAECFFDLYEEAFPEHVLQ